MKCEDTESDETYFKLDEFTQIQIEPQVHRMH